MIWSQLPPTANNVPLRFVMCSPVYRVVFEAEASEGGGVRQVVSPTLPFPLSLPSPFPFPLSFQTNHWEGRSSSEGEVPRLPPYKHHPAGLVWQHLPRWGGKLRTLLENVIFVIACAKNYEHRFSAAVCYIQDDAFWDTRGSFPNGKAVVFGCSMASFSFSFSHLKSATNIPLCRSRQVAHVLNTKTASRRNYTHFVMFSSIL